METMFKRLSWRPVAAFSILSITVIVFILYFKNHPEVWDQLGQIPRSTLFLILGLYLFFTGSLSLINTATLRLCRYKMKAGESLLLTAYSSVINFFGPLQSGPAFRALYVKQKHSIKLKDYTLASFVYYFFYAIFSVILLFSGVLKWWILPIAILIVAAIFYLKIREVKGLKSLKTLALNKWYLMAAATFIQVGLLLLIFWVELRSVSPGIQFGQVAIYTGAANLALFVSITPGAIGFREAFLVFTQNLHHIDNATIVAANTIDRAIYVLMLLILTSFILVTHAGKKLKVQSEQA
jgi:uncharacterized membrane protein YbhN (UPF0104 family)